jgi:hypothetical protein
LTGLSLWLVVPERVFVFARSRPGFRAASSARRLLFAGEQASPTEALQVH